jgi:peroxiredoxin
MSSIELTRGAMLRDITVTAAEGRRVQISDFRGRRNIVLVFEPAPVLLSELTKAGDELREEEAVVLTVPEDDRASRERYAIAGSAVFISDRYGEIYFSAEQLPPISDIMDWLRFINSQCPE